HEGTAEEAPTPPTPPAAPSAPIAQEAKPPAPPSAAAPGKTVSKHIIVKPLGGRSSVDIEIDDDEDDEAKAAAAAPPIVLPAPQREDIRRKVVGDMRRIGVGAGLILLFIPLFLIAAISKVFIDRSRAAQRMAEFRRREADYHRMSQQVT